MDVEQGDATEAAAAFVGIEGWRVEEWQRRLRKGDRFCVVCGIYGQMLYGYVVTSVRKGRLTARIFHESLPRGQVETVEIEHVDLPLSKAQFEQARAMGWPGPRVALPLILRLMPATRA